MRHVIAAEALRWLRRRGLWATVAVFLLLAVMSGVAMAASAEPPDEATVAQAKVDYASYLADWNENHQEWYQDCLDATPEDENPQAMCAETLAAPVESDYVPAPLAWADGMRSAAIFAGILGGMLAMLVAASFWGAEFRHGTIATWLTFVPDRTRVWTAKNVVAVLMSAVAALVMSAVVLGVTTIGFVMFQGPASVGDWGPPLGIAARGLGFAALAALIGAAMAVLFRNTVAAAAVPVAYLVLTSMFGAVTYVPGLEFLATLMPETNLMAYLALGTTYWVPALEPGEGMVERHLPFAHGLTYLLVLTGALAVASLIAFQRRDVAE
ncbi:ABC transporter permease subunit [Propioniciclava soli]|uniref:ABC transporter permease subunit n=1 Tax=Propioniciclava soli TaxID=2775081 RepID=UPI001E53ACB0|nr:ABC transporter permease subunit [Propioniciclava soli]